MSYRNDIRTVAPVVGGVGLFMLPFMAGVWLVCQHAAKGGYVDRTAFWPFMAMSATAIAFVWIFTAVIVWVLPSDRRSRFASGS